MYLHQDLISVLKKDDRLVVDGKLAKNKVIELALQLDVDLLELLRSSKELSKTFFQQVGDILVFDKVKFQSFVSNKQFLPDSFTEYKNKIGLSSDKQYITDSEDVVLDFPYKDCVLEGGQTKDDAKRSEVFWNETLAPDEIDKLLEAKVLTNFKKYDDKGKQPVKEITFDDNLIIKGNNLLALHSLKKTYAGKIKLIYIDPPYNTGSDSFHYNDSFSHSTWLAFMKSRLLIAKELLKDNGAIFVQIDHNECHYLKILMDEIFGRDNFRNEIIWKRSQNVSSIGNIFKRSHDTILFYAKSSRTELKKVYKEQDEKYLSQYKFNDDKGQYRHAPLLVSGKRTGSTGTPWRGIDPNKQGKSGMHWITTHQKLEALDKNGLIYWSPKGGQPMLKYYLDLEKGVVVSDVWDDINLISPTSNEGLDFVGQKPEELLKRIIESVTDENEIVLDYQAGTGTTLAVALKLGRKFIGIEQMDYIHDLPEARLKKVIDGDQGGISQSVNWKGGGSFIYVELAKANQLFVDKIQDSKNTKELLKVWDEMKKTAFLSYKVKPQEIDVTKKDFESLSFEDQQKFLISTLDKNLLYVPYSEIEDKTYKISKEDIVLNNKFYGRD
jgi:adenine-specific DNA-methyltransferase